MRGHNPAWANLPRRKCDDCGKSYKPVQPLKEGQRGFCSANCRKSYHKHGGAYRKLKAEMQKMVTREFVQIREDVRRMILHQESAGRSQSPIGEQRTRDIVFEVLRNITRYDNDVQDLVISMNLLTPAVPSPSPSRPR